MLSRVAFISAAALGTLLLAGCLKTDRPAPEQNAICFQAGSLLLRDDATKTAIVHPQDASGHLPNNSQIAVYGWHAEGSEDKWIFNGKDVSTTNGISWFYSPVEFWDWGSSSDYYDFIAVYPFDRIGTPTKTVSPRTRVAVSYNPVFRTNQYDLMMAAYRRRQTDSNNKGNVPFAFQHMLSAVKIVLYNDSAGKDIKLKGFHFKNLVTSGNAIATFDSYGAPDYEWADATRTTLNCGGVSSIDERVDHKPASGIQDKYDQTDDYDLMIPQRLDESIGGSSWPELVISYSVVSGESEQSKPSVTKNLKDMVLLSDKTTPILSWEAGRIYLYEIHLQVDGGIVVNVTTTDWDTANAETPGILI